MMIMRLIFSQFEHFFLYLMVVPLLLSQCTIAQIGQEDYHPALFQAPNAYTPLITKEEPSKAPVEPIANSKTEEIFPSSSNTCITQPENIVTDFSVLKKLVETDPQELSPKVTELLNQLFDKHYSQHINQITFQLLRANRYLALKQSIKAESILDHLIALYPSVAASYVIKANLETVRGRKQHAYQLYQTALKLTPSDTELASQVNTLIKQRAISP